MFLQSSSNYSALPFEDGANSNNHLNIIFIEMGVSKYSGLITCSLKSYFQVLQKLAQNLPMETQESMCSYKATNQITHLPNVKITALGEKPPPNTQLQQKEEGKERGKEGMCEVEKEGRLVSSFHPEKTTVYVLVYTFFFFLF